MSAIFWWPQPGLSALKVHCDFSYTANHHLGKHAASDLAQQSNIVSSHVGQVTLQVVLAALRNCRSYGFEVRLAVQESYQQQCYRHFSLEGDLVCNGRQYIQAMWSL